MKQFALYIFRLLGYSIIAGLVALPIVTYIPGRRLRDDRLAIAVVVASLFFFFQVISLPIVAYRRKAKKAPLTFQDIQNEQMDLVEKIGKFLRRYQFQFFGILIAALVGLTLLDSFEK